MSEIVPLNSAVFLSEIYLIPRINCNFLRMMGKVSADTDDIVFQKIAHDNDKETKKKDL